MPIHLSFMGNVGNPLLNNIEIIPGCHMISKLFAICAGWDKRNNQKLFLIKENSSEYYFDYNKNLNPVNSATYIICKMILFQS